MVLQGEAPGKGRTPLDKEWNPVEGPDTQSGYLRMLDECAGVAVQRSRATNLYDCDSLQKAKILSPFLYDGASRGSTRKGEDTTGHGLEFSGGRGHSD
jgi:hypothetical protein